MTAPPFPEVVGHARAREALGRSLAARTVHSGYLFAGPEGVGKRLLAAAFARAFLCLEEGAAPCGACASCRRRGDAPHPDLLLVGPDEAKKSKSIGIDQARDLSAWLALSPVWGRRKAAIVEPADAMTPDAQNALLKTLEEPPPGRLVLLVSARLGAFAPTVLSRCQLISFGALADEEVADVLRRAGWPPDAARQAATAAEGSPGAALARDGKAWQDAGGAVGRLLEALGKGDRGAVLAFAEGVREGRDQAQLLARLLIGELRLAARERLGLRPAGGAQACPGLAELGAAEVFRLLERALEVHRRLERNANQRLAFTALLAGGGTGWET